MSSMKGRVLIVDDDTALAEMLGIVLRSEGFEPFACPDGERALGAFRECRPDLVLLDLMLPGKDGIDVCREIRAESGVPIVMLTAKTDTIDVVVGLESGADDYVLKPFKPKELVARIRARLRRTDDPSPELLTIGDLSIDVAGHAVRRGSEQIALTPLEFDLLEQHLAGEDLPRLACPLPWHASRGRSSPARCCSSRSGATGTRRTPGWSTCTCSGCARRSSRIPSGRRSSSPCVVSATRPGRPEAMRP
jgi:two-component system response regulator MtrA